MIVPDPQSRRNSLLLLTLLAAVACSKAPSTNADEAAVSAPVGAKDTSPTPSDATGVEPNTLWQGCILYPAKNQVACPGAQLMRFSEVTDMDVGTLGARIEALMPRMKRFDGATLPGELNYRRDEDGELAELTMLFTVGDSNVLSVRTTAPGQAVDLERSVARAESVVAEGLPELDLAIDGDVDFFGRTMTLPRICTVHGYRHYICRQSGTQFDWELSRSKVAAQQLLKLKTEEILNPSPDQQSPKPSSTTLDCRVDGQIHSCQRIEVRWPDGAGLLGYFAAVELRGQHGYVACSVLGSAVDEHQFFRGCGHIFAVAQ